ncbi:MAG: hypothetical protein SFV32_14465 [Opitutaceae bacterium]|nr:hypothetical protein [Opitutaceae bacterium]
MKTPTLLLLALAAALPLANGAQIKLQVGPNSNNGNGGAYTAQILSGSPLTNDQYDSMTKNVGNWDPSFETFCLEKWEYFTPNTVYDFTIDSEAIGFKDGNVVKDKLSLGTTWLYSQYATGKFNSLKVKGKTYATWKDMNKDFQAAVWFLEGDINSLINPFTKLLADTFVGKDVKADATGNAFGVKALNLYTVKSGKTTYAQSQLYYQHVPDTFTTLAVFGAAISGLALFRRKVARG